MRALRLHGPKDLRLDDIPEPQLRPGTAKLHVQWAGICGSDLHNYTRGQVLPDFVHPLIGEAGPHVQGHEFSARVVAVADDVEGLDIGDLVAVRPTVSDGICAACLRDEENLCARLGFLGLMGGGGGMSDCVVVPAANAHPLPPRSSAETAALVEPLAVAWHAIGRSGLQHGDSAVITGGGPIGLCLLLAAKARGAGFVAVSELKQARQDLARTLGADLVIDPREEDVADAVRSHLPAGADTGFEASGVGDPAFGPLLRALRKGGTAVNLAQGRRATLDPNLFMTSEITLTGSLAYTSRDFTEVIAAIGDGRLRPDPLITARIPLEAAREHGYEALLTDADSHVKILVHP